MGRPTISRALYPNRRSAPWFQLVTMPCSGVALTIASCVHATVARSRSQLLVEPAALRHVPDHVAVAARLGNAVAKRRDGHVRPVAQAVRAHPPVRLLEPVRLRGLPQVALGLALLERFRRVETGDVVTDDVGLRVAGDALGPGFQLATLPAGRASRSRSPRRSRPAGGSVPRSCAAHARPACAPASGRGGSRPVRSRLQRPRPGLAAPWRRTRAPRRCARSWGPARPSPRRCPLRAQRIRAAFPAPTSRRRSRLVPGGPGGPG